MKNACRWNVLLCSLVLSVVGLHAHGGISVSSDGKWLAAGYGNSVHLWERATGKRVRRWIIPNVYRVRFSTDGRELLAVRGRNDILRVDIKTGEFKRKLEPLADGRIEDVGFDPKTNQLRVGIKTNAQRQDVVWSYQLDIGDDLLYPKETGASQEDAVWAVRLDARGAWFLSSNKADGIRYFQHGKDRPTYTIPAQRGTFLDMVPERKGVIVTAFEDEERINDERQTRVKIRTWDLASGRMRREVILDGDPQGSDIAITADGPTLWTWKKDRLNGRNLGTGTVVQYSLNENGTKGSSTGWDRILQWDSYGHKACDALAFFPDGRRFICGSNGSASILDLNTGEVLGHWSGVPSEFDMLAMAPSGKELLAGSSYGIAHLWTLEPFPPKIALRMEARHSPFDWIYNNGSARSTAVAYAPGGDCLAVAFSDGTLRIHDAKTRMLLHTLKVDTAANRLWTTGPRAPAIGISAMTFSPDGQTLASWDMTCHVTLWDFRKGKIRSKWTQDARASSMAYSPDGTILAIATPIGVTLRDARTGAIVANIAEEFGTEGFMDSAPLVFARDGSWVARGSQGGCLRVWELPGGRLLRTLFGHDSAIKGLAISPDGRTLLSGSRCFVMRWDLTALPHEPDPPTVTMPARLPYRSLANVGSH